MIEQNGDTRRVRDDAADTRLQVDPMLRPGRAPYALPIVIALGVLAIAVVLFATNQEDSEVVETGTPAITTDAAPPAKQQKQGTTGAAPDAAPLNPSTTGKNQ